MHLVFALYRVTPFGGLERNALELVNAARARGHRVSVFTRSWSGERPAGVEVRELPVHAWTNVGLDRGFARALWRELEGGEHDVVVSFNRIDGVDVFYAADPCLAARPRALALPNRRAREQWERALAAPGAPTEILVQSEDERARYREHHGTPARRLHVLPPGLRVEFLEDGPTRAPELRAELGVPADALVVLAAGSDFARKGLDRTLHALSELPEPLRARTRLLVVGAGRRPAFERLARTLALDDRVRFLGGRADVLACYRAADLLMHPARVENTGTVLLEALSQGVPVVCSAASGFAPLVEEAGGHVIAEPYDARAASRALAELLGDDARRVELGERGRVFARGFPMERRTALALEVIERVALEKHRAGAVPAPAR